MGRRRAPWLTAAALVAVVALSGCTAHSAEPTGHTSSAAPGPGTAGTDTATPTGTATAQPTPTLVKGGTAEQNLAFFDFVNRRTLLAHHDPVGADFVDGLVAAGFAKKDMQVTADKTSIGLTPGSLQFSVRVKQECLIGQYGADIGGYYSEVTPVLQTGKCLIGQTVPIR